MPNSMTIKGAAGGLSQAAVLTLITANAAPLAHKTQHQSGGSDEINATGLTGRINYVSRGDAPAPDFTITDFSTAGTYTVLDLSSIVPAGAKAVLFRLGIVDPATTPSYISLRKNGNTNDSNKFATNTQIANQYVFADGIVEVDTNRKIEYYKNYATVTVLDMNIKGWII